MFSTIRRRLCYANIVATLALVFAMSGGALAAGHYLLSSTKQISPQVLKALRGKSGAAGANGAQGPAGPQGTQGAAGPQGPAGAQGAKGETGPPGATGAQGPKGEAGSPWTAGGTLPAGKSETGAWSTSGPGGQVLNAKVVLASFAIPLAVAPTVQVVGIEEGQGEPKENERVKKENERRKLNGEPELPLTIPADCEGTAREPRATEGNFCVFVQEAENVIVRDLTLAGYDLSVTTAGVVAKLSSSVNYEEPFSAYGTWAVTAK
jgi:Collagen triple helix repeat (20 copies)